MLKVLSSILILSFVFFAGTQGFDTPNKRAPFMVKMKFALDFEQSMAATTVTDAAEWARGLWEFVAGAPGDSESDYVYGWVRQMLIGFSDTMTLVGYPTCAAIPTSGSTPYSTLPGLTISYSTGDKSVPAGSMWANSGTNYSKKVVGTYSGTNFFEIQFDCDTAKPNVYLKYNFDAFDEVDRRVELYAQHDDSTDKVSMELRMECTDADECATKTNLALAMHTADGNEYKMIGTRIVDDITDEAKRMSIHGSKSLKLADVHILDETSLSNSDSLDPLNASVDGHCVDFNAATYVPSGGGASDCSTAGFAAENELLTGMTNALSLGNYQINTIESMTISF